MAKKVKFAAGRNIAMKVPPHLYEATVQFYRDVLGLKEIARPVRRLRVRLQQSLDRPRCGYEPSRNLA